MEIKDPILEDDNSFNFFTSIWIVPFIALIIGLWLAYEHFIQMGPEIKIEFKNSGGLSAGNSVIKFRDVPVGKITKIEINSKKEGVIVYARINKDAEPFLNETTKFWIVKPEVDYSGIKGLDTILSGSYINMYAKKGSEDKQSFVGLNSPYIDINSGYYYAIESSFPIKIKKFTPIYYKGVKVGNVDNISLDTDSKNIIMLVRIYNEYGNLINKSTKFWIQSLLDLKLNDNRLEVNMAPLPILLLGGISLDTKFDKQYGRGFNKIFKLYKSQADAKRLKIGYAKPKLERFLFKFKGDVSSLEKGTQIKYKGFEIGKIKELKIEYNKDYKGFEAECLGIIDLSNFSTNSRDSFKNFKHLVQNGIIAKLAKPNPLFNKSNIVLDENNKTKVFLVKDKQYNAYVIPTKEYKSSGLIYKLAQISDKIDGLLLNSKEPIKNLGEVLNSTKSLINNANKTLTNVNDLVKTKEFKSLGKGLKNTLKDLSNTLKATKKTLKGYSSDSLFGDKLEATLKELHNTSEQTNTLLRKLNKKPNALIFGD